jgi:Flp pilus assembly protein TadG
MIRSKRGQAAMALNVVIAIFVVGSLGIAAYEFSRLMLARDQLKHCVELAALAGATTLASTSQTGVAAQNSAKQVALRLFQKNTVLGQPMTGTIEVASIAGFSPSAGNAQLYFEFDDPITKKPAAPGANANLLKVYGAYTYPFFSNSFGSIGVTAYTVLAEAVSGLPALDLVILYNNSSSSDDQTNVTFVRRYWDQNPPMQITYQIPTPGGGGPEQGPIGTIVCSKPLGTALNALEPQNLDAAGDPLVVGCPKEFSEVGKQGNTVPLRGVQNTGSPPGDAPPSLGGVGLGGMGAGPGNTKDTVAHLKPLHTWIEIASNMMHRFEQPAEAQAPPATNPWGASDSMFTDMVVNLDGNVTFGGYTDPRPSFAGYPFPDIGTLVEASRGNLENGTLFPDAQATLSPGVVEKAGYYNAYRCLAMSRLQPANTVTTSVVDFMTKIMQTTDCHFCFIAFNDRAGLNPTDVISKDAVSWAYPVAGKAQSALPQIPLDAKQDNFNTITTLLNPPRKRTNKVLMTPTGGANIASALQQALENLNNSANARLGAMQAIVIVTDKPPTVDLAGTDYTLAANNGPAVTDAKNVAQQCNAKGIPIFVLALDQTGALSSQMAQDYGDGSSGASGGGVTQGQGIVYAAGHGGMLKIVKWSDPVTTHQALDGEFYNVVRQLITLVHN